MKIVIINGAYDLLHIGHLSLINFAKDQGDYLIVALDTDERIRESKGDDRPINDIHTRYQIMNNLKAVDEVVVFGSDQELKDVLVSSGADIRVIGSDWKGKRIVGEDLVPQLIYFDRLDDRSTTEIVNRIRRVL